MTLPGHRTLSAAALVGVLALTSACGSDDALRAGQEPPAVPEEIACFGGSLSAAGSSAQENAMYTWVAGYQLACEDSLILYDSVGSGAGRSQFLEAAVDFAGSDAALDEQEHKRARRRCSDGSPAINIPGYVVPIAVIFDVEGVDSLNLPPETLARVFNQDITRWNDPEIAEHNPDTDLPDLRITPVTRADDSGTTENFTGYLDAAAGGAWPHDPGGTWPIEPVEAAQGNSGIAEAVEGGGGTIGYVEASHTADMSTVSVGVGGEFVDPSPESASRVVATSPEREGGHEHDHALELDHGTTEPGTYPIVLVTYEITCLRYGTEREAERVRAFLDYVLSKEGQEAASAETGSAPLPSDLRQRLHASVAEISGAG
ncbi:phosphate ABC transporter substrate-binding protein [Streptomonospora alba]|uniref:Phosphate-binding protein n=1 Tax=Streptomonospora alba TaxID=183763 RepID=A0A0C2JC49_9ACTN|nr:phosphate ABC transporter substrate-binding protein PstS [Streptomonospora alba]KIH96555.1 phosphate ABC transporter substrate-binding protein [Streptomonospora alba]